MMAEPVSIATAVGWCMKVVSPILSPVIKDLFAIMKMNASENLSLLDLKIVQLQLLFSQGEIELFRHKETLEPLMDNLKAVLYEAEDFLDALEYHRAETQMANLDDDKSNLAQNLQKLVLPKINDKLKENPPGLSKRKLKKILRKVESIVQEAHRTLQMLSLQRVSNDTVLSANRTTGTAKSKIIGREIDCDQIVAVLHESEIRESSPCYSVVVIHGIAGSGKTTLAQAVYARERLAGHFDVCIWIHVSHDFDPETVVREMVQAVSAEVSQGQIAETILIEKLNEKRYLLVLDDLWCWSGDPMSCEKLKHILPPRTAGRTGSKVLITSRSLDTALVLGAEKDKCFPISDLNEDTFLELFKHYAFGESRTVDKDSVLFQQLAARIVKKLKRSPLSARIVGGQLHITPTVEFWRNAESRNLLNDTVGALWWSYQQLPEPVRRCFTFCAVFPRRHRLYRQQLIRLWIAAGLIRGTNANEDTVVIGNEYFDDLVSSSFLQQGIDKFYEEHYVMHDLVHELAIQVSGSDVFRMEHGCKGDIPKNTRHMYVDTDDLEMLEKSISLQNVRT